MKFAKLFQEALSSGALVPLSQETASRIAGPNQFWFLPKGATPEKATDLCYKPVLRNGKGVFQVSDTRVWVQLADNTGAFEAQGQLFQQHVLSNYPQLAQFAQVWHNDAKTKRWGFIFDNGVDRLLFLEGARILLEYIEANSTTSKSGF